jgi:hypothetical protein
MAALGDEHDATEHLARFHLLMGDDGLLQGQYLVHHRSQLAAARGGGRHSGVPGVTAGLSAAAGSPPDAGCADFLARYRQPGRLAVAAHAPLTGVLTWRPAMPSVHRSILLLCR